MFSEPRRASIGTPHALCLSESRLMEIVAVKSTIRQPRHWSRHFTHIAALCGLLLGLASPVLQGPGSATCAAAEQPLTESDKIELLLHLIDGMQDVVFIRNGHEYDCHAAAKHLRTKWKAQLAVIKTARDFVLHLASRSSLSGKPYLLRWKNGQLQTSESFLLLELKKIEEGPLAHK